MTKKINKARFSLFLAVVLIIIAGGAYAGVKFFGEKKGPASNTPIATATPSPVPSGISHENVTLASPYSGQSVSLPFRVKGTARVFENVVSLRVKDKNGSILYSGNMMANSPDMGLFGPYDKEISYLYKKPSSQDIILEVFWSSPMDGSDMEVISIPLKIDLNMTMVKAYFGNTKLDPQNTCNQVFAVDRAVAKTQSVATEAVKALLGGIGLGEQDKGYFTSINSDVKIKSLSISNGTAKVDFDSMMEQGVGGSCRVAAIRAQITQTLKQFSSVQSVIIAVDGRTEDVLQP